MSFLSIKGLKEGQYGRMSLQACILGLSIALAALALADRHSVADVILMETDLYSAGLMNQVHSLL